MSRPTSLMLRPVFCLVLCLFFYSSAKADTFTLTSGSATTGFGAFSLFASGPNISISAAAGGSAGNLTFATCTPFPCVAGSILDVGGDFIASNLNIGLTTGTVTINGTTFNNVRFQGTLIFTGSAVLPSGFVTGTPFMVPFTMQGNLIGFAPCGQPQPEFTCEQVFDIMLTGSGVATATIPEFGARTVVYDFTDPVPEPATVGLLATGLLALGGFRKRK